jgi:hypothetical protein
MQNPIIKTPISRLIDEAKTPFIKVIGVLVQAELLAQTAYLERRGQDNPDSPEAKQFMAMADGAKTVINILENSAIGEQGTRHWLAKLDKEQLLYAQECVADLLRRKADEDKYNVYIGRAHNDCRSFLSESQANMWVLVQMKLVTAKLENTKGGALSPTFTHRDVNFTVDLKKVLLSELNDYLEGDNRVPDDLSDEAKVAFIQQQQEK